MVLQITLDDPGNERLKKQKTQGVPGGTAGADWPDDPVVSHGVAPANAKPASTAWPDDPIVAEHPSLLQSAGYIAHRGADALLTLPGAPADIAVGLGNLISRQFGGPQSTTTGPIGSDAIHGMLHDTTGYEAPGAPRNELEHWGGNLATAIAAGGPSGLTRAALKSALGSSVALSTAQEVAPDNPYLQVGAALAGGLTPQLSTLGGQMVRGSLRGTNPQNMAANLAAFDRLRSVAGQTGTPRVTAGQAAPGYNTAQVLDATTARLPGGQPDYLTTMGEQARTDQRAVENTAMNPTGTRQQRLPNPTTAGDAIRRGFETFTAKFKERARVIEHGFEQRIGTQTRTLVTNTQRALTELKQKALSDPAIAKLIQDPYIKSVDDAITSATSGLVNAAGTQIARGVPPTIGFGALRALRSDVGELIDKAALSAGIKGGQLKHLYGALSDDLTEAANAAGVGNEWQRYNKWYTAGMDRVEQTLQRTIKGREQAPDSVFAKVMSMGRRQAFQTMRSLGDEERAIVVGQALQELGFTSAVGAGADATNFSYAMFINRLSKMKKQGTFDAVFGGKEFAPLRGVIEDLERSADAAARYAKIAHDVSGATTIRSGTLMTAGGLLFSGQPLTAAGLMALAFIPPKGAAMLLRWRPFLNWLARAKSVPPANWAAFAARLNALANTDPKLKEAVGRYQEGLAHALKQQAQPQQDQQPSQAPKPNQAAFNGSGGPEGAPTPVLPNLPGNFDYAHPPGGFTPPRSEPTITDGDPRAAALAARYNEVTARRNQAQRSAAAGVSKQGETFLPGISTPLSELMRDAKQRAALQRTRPDLFTDRAYSDAASQYHKPPPEMAKEAQSNTGTAISVLQSMEPNFAAMRGIVNDLRNRTVDSRRVVEFDNKTLFNKLDAANKDADRDTLIAELADRASNAKPSVRREILKQLDQHWSEASLSMKMQIMRLHGLDAGAAAADFALAVPTGK